MKHPTILQMIKQQLKALAKLKLPIKIISQSNDASHENKKPKSESPKVEK